MNQAVTGIKRLARWLKREAARLGYCSRPSFIIIGAQKAGTSALFSMLGQHPQIVTPAEKEVHFFDGAKIVYGDFSTYHALFPLPYRLSSNQITFEASPSYLYNPECPQRIYDYSANIRLIAILREPVARAYSAWNMFRSFTNSSSPKHRKLAESRTFEEAIAVEMKMIEQTERPADPIAYVRRGIYVEQVQRYFQYFPRGALLILDHSDLLRMPEVCLAQLCRFLEIDDAFRFEIERKNVSNYESDIPEAAAEILHSFYAPHNKSLFRLLGKEFKW